MKIDMSEVCEWARIGGAIARRYFHQPMAQQRKADNTHVTQADIEIEHFLREHIGSRYPQHGIMGEEQGIGSIDCEYVWSLDPLDGTDAYVAGLPVWAVSIGLLRNGQPYLGAIYLPITDECYWVDTDGVAYCNGHPISVSEEHEVAAHHSIMVPSRSHIDYDIQFPGKVRSLGSFAAHICYVARGSVVGALLGYPQLWDIAAGLAILHAAGGCVVRLSGQPFDDVRSMLDGRRPTEPLLVSTPAMVPALLPDMQTKGAT